MEASLSLDVTCLEGLVKVFFYSEATFECISSWLGPHQGSGGFAGAPCEPFGETSFRDLAKKTLFLVLLVTARRVGQLQALSAKVARVGGNMSLAYLPGFVSKTEFVTNLLPRSFLLKSQGFCW